MNINNNNLAYNQYVLDPDNILAENMNYDVFITEEELEQFDEMHCNYDEDDFE